MKDFVGRQVINPPSIPQPPGWSHAVRAGDFVFGSGILATDYRQGLLPEARPNPASAYTSEEPLGLEAKVILESIIDILDEAGGDARCDLIRLWQWFRSEYPDDDSYAKSQPHWPVVPSGDPYVRSYRSVIQDGQRTSTGIGVKSLPLPEAMMSIDFMAVTDGSGREKRRIDAPEGVPQPHLGYCPGIRYKDWVFLSGFGGTDFNGSWMSEKYMGEPSMIAPEARVNPYVWLGSETEAQTRFALHGLKLMAEAGGSSLDRCVRADVTIAHPSNFTAMDRVWQEFFPDVNSAPARSVVTGAQLVQKGLQVEIAMLLLSEDSSLERKVIQVPNGPVIAGQAPQAVRAGDYVFTSTMLPLDTEETVPLHMAKTEKTPHFVDPAYVQTEYIAGRLKALCAAEEMSLADVCKVHVTFDDMHHMPGMLNAWRETFPEDPPALSAIGAGGAPALLAEGAAVQWDAVLFSPR